MADCSSCRVSSFPISSLPSSKSSWEARCEPGSKISALMTQQENRKHPCGVEAQSHKPGLCQPPRPHGHDESPRKPSPSGRNSLKDLFGMPPSAELRANHIRNAIPTTKQHPELPWHHPTYPRSPPEGPDTEGALIACSPPLSCGQSTGRTQRGWFFGDPATLQTLGTPHCE